MLPCQAELQKKGWHEELRGRPAGQRANLPASGISTADIIQVIEQGYKLLNSI